MLHDEIDSDALRGSAHKPATIASSRGWSPRERAWVSTSIRVGSGVSTMFRPRVRLDTLGYAKILEQSPALASTVVHASARRSPRTPAAFRHRCRNHPSRSRGRARALVRRCLGSCVRHRPAYTLANKSAMSQVQVFGGGRQSRPRTQQPFRLLEPGSPARRSRPRET